MLNLFKGICRLPLRKNKTVETRAKEKQSEPVMPQSGIAPAYRNKALRKSMSKTLRNLYCPSRPQGGEFTGFSLVS
jgi:hypothetical protein